MRIHLHIGLDLAVTTRLQAVLEAKRDQLAAKGVLFPRAPGPRNHTRLFMAATDPDHVDPLRFNRGHATAAEQAALRDTLMETLTREIASHRPDILILSAAQLGTALARPGEIARLHGMLTAISDDIRVTAHVDDQARQLARHYATQVFEGRATRPEVELGLCDAADWWQAATAAIPEIAPARGVYLEAQGPLFWLDYRRLVAEWEAAFGTGTVALRPCDPALFGPRATDELRAAFGISGTLGKAAPGRPPAPPAAAWLARGRQLNALLLRLLAQGGRVLPRPLWLRFMQDIRIDGPPQDEGALRRISDRFAADMRQLCTEHPALAACPPAAPPPAGAWAEADPGMGFRASQYLAAFLWRIDHATAEADAARDAHTAAAEARRSARPSAAALKVMPPLALRKYSELVGSSFRPHDRLGHVDETADAAPYRPAPPREPPAGSTGRVIVACMKDEAPYILEWIAHHRAIGFDHFLIYTNDCSDGTDAMLRRLDRLGIVTHRDNDGWTGKSPQQHALDRALDEDVIRRADWIAHIDVDEFVNVRCGNGTLDDFLNRVPGATNVAMTWRLFGHNGVHRFEDRLVTGQFDTCAPKFCPKPHTAWGFKTLFANIGAYRKMSCHRPNKPVEDKLPQIAWVNGSGAPMPGQVVRNGWRSSRNSVGYDLLQLNHYALRSAESFLIKRARGRALHVDREIGLNYWIRMDWSDVRDATIQRNLPRLRAERGRLVEDAELRRLHDAAVAWHRTRAAALLARPEAVALFRKAVAMRLTEHERVAFALALDTDS